MRNRKIIAAGCAISGLLVWAAVPTGAAIITGVTIEDFSSQLAPPTSFTRDAVHTIDGSGGVPLGAGVGTHSEIPDGTMWLTTGDGIAGGGVDPQIANAVDPRIGHIVFDLGAIYNVSSFHLWNYNEVNLSSRGAQLVAIRTADTETMAGPTNTDADDVQFATFTQATGANTYAGEDYTLPFIGRYVRIDILSSYNGDNGFVGLSEIRFDGVLVPEPTGLGLLATVGLLGCCRRRRLR